MLEGAHADAWTVGAQHADFEAVDDGIQVFSFGVEGGLGVELLGDRWVGFGVDLLGLQRLGHGEFGACCERSDGEGSERSGFCASLDGDS